MNLFLKKKTSKKWKCLQAPWFTQITKIPIRHQSLQKKNGVCHNHLWNNPKQLEKHCITKGLQLPVNLWGPRFSLGFPRWIGGGPRFFQATTTDGSIIANPPPERDTWPNRDTAAPGVKVGGAEKWREGFPVPVTWDMWTQVQDHLEVGFELFETIFIRHLGFSCKFEKQIKIKVLNYHYHVFKNFHLSKSRWKETTSIIL